MMLAVLIYPHGFDVVSKLEYIVLIASDKGIASYACISRLLLTEQ